MSEFTVSIVIPVYNRQNLIIDTLNSILKQTYNLWECIVVNDFSTDATELEVKKISAQDHRVKLINNTRSKGANGARNTGLEISKGDLICFFDSDNIMHSTYLEKKVVFLINNPQIDIVTSFSNVLNSDFVKVSEFDWITDGHILKDLIKGKTYVDTNSAMIRRKFITHSNYWDERCPSYQEFDFHIRLSEKVIYGYIPEILTDYFRRNTGTISSDKLKDLKGRIFILNKHKNVFIKYIGHKEYKNKLLSLENEIKPFYLLKDYSILCLFFKITIFRIFKKKH